MKPMNPIIAIQCNQTITTNRSLSNNLPSWHSSFVIFVSQVVFCASRECLAQIGLTFAFHLVPDQQDFWHLIFLFKRFYLKIIPSSEPFHGTQRLKIGWQSKCARLKRRPQIMPSNPFNIQHNHYFISKSDILEINCSSIAHLEKCISQDTEPLQGAYNKI